MVHGENAYDRLNEIEEYDELEVMKLEDKLCELKILEDKIIWDKSTPEIIDNAKASFELGLRQGFHERTSSTSVHLFFCLFQYDHEMLSESGCSNGQFLSGTMVLSYHHKSFLSKKRPPNFPINQ